MYMKIVNMFDALIEGNFKEFQRLYNGNINDINEFTQLNLLQTTLVNTNNEGERIKIISYLLSNGININYQDKKYRRNALHTVFFNFLRGDIKYLSKVVEMLINSGIDINRVDIYNAVPLKYAITVCKLKTEEMRDVYSNILRAGADYNLKDIFGKSCMDYAKELSWRTEFIKIVEEMKNDR